MRTARFDIKYNAKFHTITMADFAVKRKIDETATLPKKRGKYAHSQDRTTTISTKACHRLCVLRVGKEKADQYYNELAQDLYALIKHMGLRDTITTADLIRVFIAQDSGNSVMKHLYFSNTAIKIWCLQICFLMHKMRLFCIERKDGKIVKIYKDRLD